MYELAVLKRSVCTSPYNLKEGLIVKKIRLDAFMVIIRTTKEDSSVLPSTIISLNGCTEITLLKRVAEEYFKATDHLPLEQIHLNSCKSLLESAYKSTPENLLGVKSELSSALELLKDYIARGSWYHCDAEEFFLCHIGNAILRVIGNR
jgi:hypothetical protein